MPHIKTILTVAAIVLATLFLVNKVFPASLKSIFI